MVNTNHYHLIKIYKYSLHGPAPTKDPQDFSKIVPNVDIFGGGKPRKTSQGKGGGGVGKAYKSPYYIYARFIAPTVVRNG